MNDELAELLFPLSGIDEARELEEQRPGTTPSGVNVRAFEPATQRARGGARPGLVRYVPAQVNGALAVQLLDAVCVTTDPAGMGGVISVEDGLTIDPVPGSAQDPGGGAGGDGSGGFFGFQPVFNWNRPGGDSVRFKNKRRKKLEFVQAASSLGLFANLTASQPFVSSVTAGHLLVAAVAYRIGVGATTATGVADSVGTTFTKIGGLDLVDGAGAFWGLSLWYGVAPASGPDTVTWTMSALTNTRAALLEYKGNTATPLGGSSTNSSGVATTACTTGSVAVAELRDLVLAAFYMDENTSFSVVPAAGFVVRLANFIYVVDGGFGVATAGAVTLGSASIYAGVGASFKHG